MEREIGNAVNRMWKRQNDGEKEMKKKIGLGKWTIAVLFSMIVIPSIIISVFVFPVEMIALNAESYTEFVDGDEYIGQMPPVIAEIAVNQVLLVGETPPVLARKANFQSALVPHLPDAWVRDATGDLIENTLDYFNFKTPYASIAINISALKRAIASNSTTIADDYIQSLAPCQAEQKQRLLEASELEDFPPCKPDGAERADLAAQLAVYLEDKAAGLPDSLNLVGIVPSGMLLGERAFYWYSIGRWASRLLPFLTIGMLILIAWMLRNDKKTMRAWVGWILLGIPGLILIAALVLLVGLDQFIGLLFNRAFSLLIAGFGNVLLSIVRVIANQVLLWVLAISTGISLFGLILVLAAKYSKSEPAAELDSDDSPALVDNQNEKSVVPQTLEEIEEEEKKSEKAE
jgi:hypothetical protein